MAPRIDRSEGGIPIVQYEARERAFEPDFGDPETIEAVSAHVERHLGRIGVVFHEIVSDLVHIDLLHVPPTRERPFHTLVTCGMSTRPMNVPEDAEELRYAELMLSLPPDWPQIGRAHA